MQDLAACKGDDTILLRDVYTRECWLESWEWRGPHEEVGTMCHIGSGHFFLLAYQVCKFHSLNVNCKVPTMHFLRNQKF